MWFPVDQVWFTFFHEAGHILLHGKKDVFLELHGMTSEKEEEANRFASNILIPPDELNEFLQERVTLSRIQQFANRIGTHPGIVVGRLQRDKRLGYKVGQKLKLRLKWA